MVLRGTIRSVVMAQQLIMDLVWEEMETALGVMQFMIPDEVCAINFCSGLCLRRCLVRIWDVDRSRPERGVFFSV